MNKQDISIATITWARDENEEKLIRESLQELAQLNIPVFITDGGSGPEFIKFINSFPHFNLLENIKGVWPQAKNSLSQAYQSGSKFIFYTEPDKLDFFSQSLSKMIDTIEADEQTGIVLASRSASGFATFPAFQQITETTINNCCAETIGQTVDYTYGPFLVNRKLVPYLSLINEDIGWGWRPYTFGIASRLNLKVEAFVADFNCPPDQQEDSSKERIYRMRQLAQNIQGIVLSTTVKMQDF